MIEKIIYQFDQFLKTIEDEINLKDNELTKQISDIHNGLWNNYKGKNGTSAGFYGIDEYIVFSTFKKFIENLNEPQKFKIQSIDGTKDLRFFKLESNNKCLSIYRASSLKHFPPEAKSQLFKNNSKFRAPDIVILNTLSTK